MADTSPADKPSGTRPASHPTRPASHPTRPASQPRATRPEQRFVPREWKEESERNPALSPAFWRVAGIAAGVIAVCIVPLIAEPSLLSSSDQPLITQVLIGFGVTYVVTLAVRSGVLAVKRMQPHDMQDAFTDMLIVILPVIFILCGLISTLILYAIHASMFSITLALAFSCIAAIITAPTSRKTPPTQKPPTRTE